MNPVLKTTLKVIHESENVNINRQKIEDITRRWVKQKISVPSWPKKILPKTKDPRIILDYLIVLAALNFCFWSKKEKWGILYKGKSYDGYFALAFALKKFFEEYLENADFHYLSKISFKEFSQILNNSGELLFLRKRWKILQAVSRAMITKYDGDSKGFILSANHRAENLVKEIVRDLPFFNDVAEYNDNKIYFLKRAQLLVSDIWGVFNRGGIGEFNDMDYLTAFADYKIPQILRYLKILEFNQDLGDKIEYKKIIPAGSKEEVEIRSATIWAVEYLREALEKYGQKFYSFQIDWLLWNKSQSINHKFPYHLTETIFY